MSIGSVSPTPRNEPTKPISLDAKRAARARNRSQGASTSRNGASRDAINVSAEGRELSRFDTAAERVAERNRLVDRLKSAVDGGTYRPDPAAIARAMGRRSDA
jgi:flagellar biosynthesis anti-sigma factor FlgM